MNIPNAFVLNRSFVNFSILLVGLHSTIKRWNQNVIWKVNTIEEEC